MKIKLHNNDNTDAIIYEGTIKQIREQSKFRIQQSSWKDGWSEVLEE